MGEVIQFPQGKVQGTRIQVSKYPQDDGRSLYCVEILFPDGKWDQLHNTRSRDAARELAEQEASARGVIVLPDSLWPGRSSREEG